MHNHSLPVFEGGRYSSNVCCICCQQFDLHDGVGIECIGVMANYQLWAKMPLKALKVIASIRCSSMEGMRSKTNVWSGRSKEYK